MPITHELPNRVREALLCIEDRATTVEALTDQGLLLLGCWHDEAESYGDAAAVPAAGGTFISLALMSEADRRWGRDAVDRLADYVLTSRASAPDVTRWAETSPARVFRIMGLGKVA